MVRPEYWSGQNLTGQTGCTTPAQSPQQTEGSQDIPVLDQPAIATHSGTLQSADHLDNDVANYFKSVSKANTFHFIFYRRFPIL